MRVQWTRVYRWLQCKQGAKLFAAALPQAILP